jgi:predicted  nucleic acid-binding Zn-ribbon protein
MSEISDALTRAETAQTVAVAEIETERDALQTQRTALASGIDADFLKLYEKIRSDNAGVGAAKLTQGRCDGCRIQLNPVAMAKARTAPSNEVLRCEECRVVLVRTDESGL